MARGPAPRQGCAFHLPARASTFHNPVLRLGDHRSGRWMGNPPMRKAIICLAGIALIAACSKAPTDAGKSEAAAAAASGTAASAPTTPAAPTAAVTGPPVSGTYTANGKPAALTQVTAHPDEPFDGKPRI